MESFGSAIGIAAVVVIGGALILWLTGKLLDYLPLIFLVACVLFLIVQCSGP